MHLFKARNKLISSLEPQLVMDCLIFVFDLDFLMVLSGFSVSTRSESPSPFNRFPLWSALLMSFNPKQYVNVHLKLWFEVKKILRRKVLTFMQVWQKIYWYQNFLHKMNQGISESFVSIRTCLKCFHFSGKLCL